MTTLDNQNRMHITYPLLIFKFFFDIHCCLIQCIRQKLFLPVYTLWIDWHLVLTISIDRLQNP